MTNSEICWAAGKVLQDYQEELKKLREDASDPRQIAFLEYQLAALPNAMFLLGAAAGRDSLKRSLPAEALADFDRGQR